MNQDYLLRLIEQLGIVFRQLLRKSAAGEPIEADLEAVATEWTGLSLDMLLFLPPEELFRFFEESERLEVEKSYVAAEVARLKAATATDPKTRADFGQRALFFYRKCSGRVDTALESKIETHIAELSHESKGKRDT